MRPPKGPPRRVLRLAEQDDLESFRSLLASTWFQPSDLDDQVVDGRRLRGALELAGVVIGTAVLDEHGDLGVLRTLSIDPHHRRRGHGAALAAFVIRLAYEHGLGSVYAASVRWYRKLVAAKYDGSGKRGPGRPPTSKSITDIVVEMARSNPTWGYTRIRGALHNLGHDVARNTIKNTLLANGLEPAPERGKGTPWRTFIQSHLGAIAGADFFTVEVLTPFGLVRYFVFFVIDIGSRRVHIAGITNEPSEARIKQIARNLTDCADGFLNPIRYLILDRDPLYTSTFRKMLRTAGVKVVRLPARSPNLNAFAERFVRSIKSECLARIIPLGERHLRHVITEFVEHYHRERNHQGLGNRLIEPLPANSNGRTGIVRRREHLGGLLNYYHREAA